MGLFHRSTFDQRKLSLSKPCDPGGASTGREEICQSPRIGGLLRQPELPGKSRSHWKICFFVRDVCFDLDAYPYPFGNMAGATCRWLFEWENIGKLDWLWTSTLFMVFPWFLMGTHSSDSTNPIYGILLKPLPLILNIPPNETVAEYWVDSFEVPCPKWIEPITTTAVP